MQGKLDKNPQDLGAEERLLKAKSDALRLLSFKPRSIEELRGKLKDKGFDAGIIDAVIENFKKQGFLNDEKYAQLFTNARIHTRPAGKRQLERDLKQKGLAKEVVAKAMQGLEDYDEKATAMNLAKPRFERTRDLPSAKRKNRLFGFLQRRGFTTDIIFSVLNDLFKGEVNDNG